MKGLLFCGLALALGAEDLPLVCTGFQYGAAGEGGCVGPLCYRLRNEGTQAVRLLREPCVVYELVVETPRGVQVFHEVAVCTPGQQAAARRSPHVEVLPEAEVEVRIPALMWVSEAGAPLSERLLHEAVKLVVIYRLCGASPEAGEQGAAPPEPVVVVPDKFCAAVEGAPTRRPELAEGEAY